MKYATQVLAHYGIKQASDELSDLKKAIAAIKRDKWPVAKKLMKDMERKWRKDRDVYNILTVFEFHAEENDYSDHDKHGKQALRALERLEAAFKAGYPSMDGVKALKKH